MAKRKKAAALVAVAVKVPTGDFVAFGRSVARSDIESEEARLGRVEWLRASLGAAPTAEAIEQARTGHEAGYLIGWASVARTAKVGDIVTALPVEEMARWAAVPKGTKGLPMLATAMLAAARNANRVAWCRLMDGAYPERVKAREAAAAAPTGKTKGRPRKAATTTEAAPAAQGVPTIPMVCETIKAMWSTMTTEERTKLVEAVGQTFRVLATAAKAGKAQRVAA